MVALDNDYKRLSPGARSHLFLDRQMIVDGRETPSATGDMISVIDPNNGETVDRVPSANANDVDRAARVARKAFDEGPWPNMPPGERERTMPRLADLVERDRELSRRNRNGGKRPCAERGLYVLQNCQIKANVIHLS